MDKRKETYLARQAMRLTRGEINRRRFIMSALATGVTLPTAMGLAGRAGTYGDWRQVCAALGAGNTVLAKPAEQTPLIAMLGVQILHRQFIAGDLPRQAQQRAEQLGWRAAA